MNWKLLVATLCTGLAVTLVVGLVDYATSGPRIEPAVEQPLPLQEEAPLTETDLGQFKSTFGPFETLVVNTDTPNPDTRHPAVLLLNQDGSTQASTTWTVTVADNQWTSVRSVQIRSLSIRGDYAVFGTNRDRTFMVRANQPFVFEEVPGAVFVIDSQGRQFSLTATRATALRQAL